jgi:hypothetical protein
MGGRGQEGDQVVAPNRGRHGVAQRMIVEHPVLHHGGIEHHAHPDVGVVQRRERGDGAGLDAERRAQELGRAEREAAAGAEPAVQRLELDRRIFERHHQEQGVLLVLEEQVLGMAAGDLAAQRARLLDREHRRMGHGRVRDAEPVEIREQVVGGGGHGDGTMAGLVEDNCVGNQRAGDTFSVLPPPCGEGWGGGRAKGTDRANARPIGPGQRPRLQIRPPFGIASLRRSSPPCPNGCGCSSGVEHDLAKVGVEGSNPFARSNT